MIYPILPVPKPRMTRRDKWMVRPCVARYRAFADHCRALGVKLPDAGSRVVFVLPMPESWSEKKRIEMDGQPHQQKPDVGNLLKALEDAVRPDDERIWNYERVEKRWGKQGWVQIEVNNVLC